MGSLNETAFRRPNWVVWCTWSPVWLAFRGDLRGVGTDGVVSLCAAFDRECL